MRTISEQQQEEQRLRDEEDRKAKETAARKQLESDAAVARIRRKAEDITESLHALQQKYENGKLSVSQVKSEAAAIAGQARELLGSETALSDADTEVVKQVISTITNEAESLSSRAEAKEKEAVEKQRKKKSDTKKSGDAKETERNNTKKR